MEAARYRRESRVTATLGLPLGCRRGKIVLPRKPRSQRKGRSFCRALFAAGLAFVPVIRSMPTSRPGALC